MIQSRLVIAINAIKQQNPYCTWMFLAASCDNYSNSIHIFWKRCRVLKDDMSGIAASKLIGWRIIWNYINIGLNWIGYRVYVWWATYAEKWCDLRANNDWTMIKENTIKAYTHVYHNSAFPILILTQSQTKWVTINWLRLCQYHPKTRKSFSIDRQKYGRVGGGTYISNGGPSQQKL